MRHVQLFTGQATVSIFLDIYVRQVNGVKLADIMFSLLCVCLCALSPIGLNGRNAEKCI